MKRGTRVTMVHILNTETTGLKSSTIMRTPMLPPVTILQIYRQGLYNQNMLTWYRQHTVLSG